MEEPPVLKEDRHDRALRALQVAAVSGFAEDYRDIQTSCLFLCNACRDGVPVPRLKIRNGVPSSLLAELHPGISRLGSQARSRVLPYRRVLKVQWTISLGPDSMPYLDLYLNDKDIREQRDNTLNIDMNEVKWPEETADIALLHFDRSIESIAWPSSLVRLAFCIPDGPVCTSTLEIFNQPLDGVTFPPCLRELLLGVSFSQPIDNVIFPEGLERLSMPGFHQSLQNVHWPVGLKNLELLDPVTISIREGDGSGESLYVRRSFNQPLDSTLPSTLETLWLSDDFDHPVDGVVWPTNLVKVGFGKSFHGHSLGGIVWPSSLRLLVVCNNFPEVYGELPKDCVVINRSGDCWSDEWENPDEWDEVQHMIGIGELGDGYDGEYSSETVIDDDDSYHDFVL